MAEETSTLDLRMAAARERLSWMESFKLKTRVEEQENEYTDEASLKRISSRDSIKKKTFCQVIKFLGKRVYNPLYMAGAAHTHFRMKPIIKALLDLPIKKVNIEYSDIIRVEGVANRKERKEKILMGDEFSSFGMKELGKKSNSYADVMRRATRKNKGNVPLSVKQTNTTGNKFFQDNDESYDDIILYAKGALDWDGKMPSQLQDKFTLNKYGAMDVGNEGCSIAAQDDNGNTLYTKISLESNDKMTSQLEEKSRGGNLNARKDKGMQGEKEEEGKRKESVRRVSSSVIATLVLLWILFDICTRSPIAQHQPLHGHSPVFINWSSLVELFGFIVFIWAIVATIVVGAPFSLMQSGMIMFWAIWMLVRSAKSMAEVYVQMWGIVLMGWYMLMENQPPSNKEPELPT
ncbi:unnamed protein product [Sphenostylis stenocarpa]|uniref:Uncharacterized protein n=1 Tax=Sphenostylis stenocarpa TaxID=92480 RepID=A0AA86V911_9FABA|nr:unnamed protein product [Sphenostylis stenocarpa]